MTDGGDGVIEGGEATEGGGGVIEGGNATEGGGGVMSWLVERERRWRLFEDGGG